MGTDAFISSLAQSRIQRHGKRVPQVAPGGIKQLTLLSCFELLFVNYRSADSGLSLVWGFLPLNSLSISSNLWWFLLLQYCSLHWIFCLHVFGCHWPYPDFFWGELYFPHWIHSEGLFIWEPCPLLAKECESFPVEFEFWTEWWKDQPGLEFIFFSDCVRMRLWSSPCPPDLGKCSASVQPRSLALADTDFELTRFWVNQSCFSTI